MNGVERARSEHARDFTRCALVEALAAEVLAVVLGHGPGDVGRTTFVRLASQHDDVLDHGRTLVWAWSRAAAEHDRERE